MESSCLVLLNVHLNLRTWIARPRPELFRDGLVLVLVVLALWSATIMNVMTVPQLGDVRQRIWLVLRTGLARNLGMVLVLPVLIWTVERSARLNEPAWKRYSAYVLCGAVYISTVLGLEHLVNLTIHPWLKQFVSRPGRLSPFWGNFQFRFTSMLPVTLLLVLVKHSLVYGRRLADREARAAQLENQLAQARLETVRDQIQPHFLFNALSVIYAHISPDNHTAQRMIQLLSRFLRSAVASNLTQAMTLQEEIDFLSPYLEIQKLRFEDRLRVVIEVPEALATRQIPHFLLQPLVENAMKHGVGRKLGPVTVWIRAWEEEAFLHLAVEDDGGGINPVIPVEPGTGAGHRITRFRLQHLFGRTDLFACGSRPEGGYANLLRIPAGFEGSPPGEAACAS